MSTVRFIADLHLGHVNMALHRGFSSVEEHDEYIISQWNKKVHKKDTTWILGDVTMESTKSYPLLNRLNGLKKVVLGNHDMPNHIPELLKYVNSVSGMVRYKGLWLTHCPVHDRELEFRVPRNIHGHIHDKKVMRISWSYGNASGMEEDDRYLCVSCEQVDYAPISLDELKSKYFIV
jgi:calcineurin-like phosphoesterase family protein